MTLLLHLVRHGETDWNLTKRLQGSSDIPLNATGQAHARALSRLLASRPLRGIYSSPASRATETAETIALPHRLPVTVDQNLRELNQGKLEGLTREEIVASHAPFLAAWTERPSSVRLPGGETLGEVQQRMWRAVETIRQTHASGEIVLISHQIALQCLLCHILGVSLDEHRRLRVDVASVSHLEIRDGRILVASVNLTDHLCDLSSSTLSPLRQSTSPESRPGSDTGDRTSHK